MKAILIIIFLVVHGCLNLKAQRSLKEPYLGLTAYSTRHTDVFSFSSNQASLAQLKNSGIGIYGERKFMMAELSGYTTAVAIKTNKGNFGLKAAYLGFGSYNEMQFGLAHAKSLGSKLDLGLQFNYNGRSITGYENNNSLSIELGGIFHINERLNMGMQFSRDVGHSRRNENDNLPAIMTVGVGYEASDKFLFRIEIVKEEDQPVNVNAGFQYDLLPQLRIRTGISTVNSSISFGVGWKGKKIQFDVISNYHSALGLSPGLIIFYDIKKPEL